jgi:glucosyl-dolichyl phosphate glucuronosyltransferase
MKKRLRISVIICTRNRLDCLPNCLVSLANQSSKLDELIIIDSSDIPLICQEPFNAVFNSSFFGDTQLIYRHTRPGLTYQRNFGVDMAHGDIFYFFDDDVELDPHYIKEMQRVFAGHPYYGGGMGTITNLPTYKRNFNYLSRIFFLIQRNYASGMFTSSGMPTHPYGLASFKNIHVIGGCGFAYRAEIFHIHRFDENLIRYAYMEDCDFSKRVSKNRKMFFNPYAKLVHHKSPLAREKLLDFRTMFTNYYTYLFFKNFYSERKLRIIPYLWSMSGLFLESVYSTVTQRNFAYFVGYWRGIFQYIVYQRNLLP